MFLLKVIQRFFFFLFLLDILFFGSGVNIPGLGINSRKIFFAIFFLLSFLIYILFVKKTVSVIFNLLIACFFLFLWIFLIPLLKNGNLSYALSDAMPLIASGVFLLTVDFPNWERSWEKFRKIIFYFLIVFSILHIVLYIIFLRNPDSLLIYQAGFSEIFDKGVDEDAHFVFFTPLDGLVRVYFGSSFFLLIGVYFSLSHENFPFINTKFFKVFFSVLIVAALWATNTRSLMIGAASMFLFLPIFRLLMVYIGKNWFSIFFLLILPFVLIFFLIPTVDEKLLEVLGIGRGGSDDIRSIQLYPLLNAFFENFLFGNGFGSSASFVRAEDSPYAYELSILALLMKIGILGLMTACGVFASVIHSISRKYGGEVRGVSAVYALYVAFIVSNFYNPYIFGFFGTLFLIFILYEFSFLVRMNK